MSDGIEIVYLGLGAGVQSSTLAEMVAEGELAPPDYALFADLEDEPAHVYDQLDYLEARLATRGVPLVRLRPGSIVERLFSDEALSIPVYVHYQKAREPVRAQRWCTKLLKIEPAEAYARQVLAERGLAYRVRRPYGEQLRVRQGVTVQAMLGISMDEVHRLRPSRTVWLENVWPLVDRRMTRADCVAWLERRGLPLPGKSNCRICPFHPVASWRAMRRERPGDFEYVVEVERRLNEDRAGAFARAFPRDARLTMLRSGSLAELDTIEEQATLFDACDEGYCWV